MGQVFDLISDKALEKLDGYYSECHVYGRAHVDLYAYMGRLTLSDRSIDSEIYAVCAECILTKPLSHIGDSGYIKTIKTYLESEKETAGFKDRTKDDLIRKYQQTPNIPNFAQYDDRPLCCSDITEFIGYPSDNNELYMVTQTTYWEKGMKKSESYNFKKYGSPKSLREVAAFRCHHCDKHYFTFQFT